MDSEQKQLLSLPMLPARLDVPQAAQFLGFQAHDITTLVRARLLTPLGRPAPNSPKYFATVELQRLRSDLHWLSKATDAVQSGWRQKNHTEPPRPTPGRRRNGHGQPAQYVRRPASVSPVASLEPPPSC